MAKYKEVRRRLDEQKFGWVKDGDWFVYEGALYQKCRERNQGNRSTHTAYCPSTGEVCGFHDEWKVEMVNAVTIDYRIGTKKE